MRKEVSYAVNLLKIAPRTICTYGGTSGLVFTALYKETMPPGNIAATTAIGISVLLIGAILSFI